MTTASTKAGRTLAKMGASKGGKAGQADQGATVRACQECSQGQMEGVASQEIDRARKIIVCKPLRA